MITAEEYRLQNADLLQEYEERVRRWLFTSGKEDISRSIPYFRDGVVCPETWFREGNNFRPLFVLKEVSLGINYLTELPRFLETWGHQEHFEFVENPFDDIRIGTFSQWKRIARLAKGLEEIYNGADDCDYYKYNLDFQDGGEEYLGNITGYCTHNRQRTANVIYNQIVDRMAILEIKKVGAGQTVNSELSLATKHYSEHVEPFEDLLCRQIRLIDPTVVVCLGREWGNCISQFLSRVKTNTGQRLWIDGCHHTRSSNLEFYEKPLRIYRDYLRG